MNKYKISFIILTCCILTWLIIGLSVYFGGYYYSVLINKSLKPSESIIVNIRDVSKECKNFYCSGKTCMPIYYTCYDHYASFQYTPSNEYVMINNTQVSEILLYNDKSSTQNKYYIGKIVDIYYNICAFIPLYYTDQLICDKHKNIEPLHLNLEDSVNMFNASIASLVILCFFSVILLIVGVNYFLCDVIRKNKIVINQINVPCVDKEEVKSPYLPTYQESIQQV